ncbi:MAG TPA: hypothetical protein PLQ09_02305 [Prolixibacteraceae bacterium]|nr:hypothetical protein [Prolixibacteraceae bacterium]
MRLIITVLILLIYSLDVYSQEHILNTNIYRLDSLNCFNVSWETDKKNKKEIIDTIDILKVVTYKDGNTEHYSCLAEDNSIHFLNFAGGKYGLIKSFMFLKQGDGYLMFPKEIFSLERGDVLVVSNEPEGPIFNLSVFKWVNDSIENIFVSKDYFSYPSWNPFIKKEKVRLEKQNVLIPYCDGCQSGKDGTLKQNILIFNEGKRKYEIK